MMPALGTPPQPRLQIPRQCGSAGQEPQAGFGKRSPHAPAPSLLQINSPPVVAPQHLPHQPPIPVSPLPALPIAAPVPMLNPITSCPPRGLSHRHASSHHHSSPPGGMRQRIGDLHQLRAGNAAGSKPSADFARRHSLTPQPCPGDFARLFRSHWPGDRFWANMGFIGRPGLPGGLSSLLRGSGKGKTCLRLFASPGRCSRERVNGARPSQALLGRLGRAER